MEKGVITTPVSMELPPPPTATVVTVTSKPPKLKSIGDAYVLGFPLGFLGLHHFYLGSVGMGLAYLFTFGCFGVGWLVDWFRMPMLVKDANRKIERKWKLKNEDPAFREDDAFTRYELDTKRLSDCYVLGFATGFLGFHQFYLRRCGWGVLYLLTFGMLGVGVLMDWFRMPVLFKRYKLKLKMQSEGKDEGLPEERYLDDAYLCCFPLGLLGFHHFYLRRPCWGVLYFCTLGFFGIGFLIDMCRMKSLVDDANRRAKLKVERQKLISGSNHAAGVSGQYAVSYNTQDPSAAANYNGPSGAPPTGGQSSSYQFPAYPPTGISISAPYDANQPGYHPPPPPGGASNHSGGIAPPPYTPVAEASHAMPALMQEVVIDEDGVDVNKTGMFGIPPDAATAGDGQTTTTEKKTEFH